MKRNRDLLLGEKRNALSSSNFDQKPVQNNKKLVTKNFGKFCLALIHKRNSVSTYFRLELIEPSARKVFKFGERGVWVSEEKRT